MPAEQPYREIGPSLFGSCLVSVDLTSVDTFFERGPFSGPIRDGILSQEAVIAIVWRIFNLKVFQSHLTSTRIPERSFEAIALIEY